MRYTLFENQRDTLLLVARILGNNSEAARLWLARLWEILRPVCCGRPAVIPRIWNT